MTIANIKAAASTKVRKGPPCEVCDLLDRLTDTEASALRELLADTTVRYSVLADALRDDPDTDIDIPANTLSRHARGGCAARDKLR